LEGDSVGKFEGLCSRYNGVVSPASVSEYSYSVVDTAMVTQMVCSSSAKFTDVARAENIRFTVSFYCKKDSCEKK